MRKHILIVEADENQRNKIVKIIENMKLDVEIVCAESENIAYSCIMEQAIDVAVVNIVLNSRDKSDVSGIKFVSRLRKVEGYRFTPVIFMSKYEDYDGFLLKRLHSFEVVDTKFDIMEISVIVREALRYTTPRDSDPFLFMKKDGVLYSINKENISYIESSNHIVYIHKCNKEVLEFPYSSIERIMNTLDCEYFVQCSRRNIVNRKQIKIYDYINKILTLYDGSSVYVGEKFIEKILR